MTKQQILDEIKRTAELNRGTPLGRERFFQETGIKESDWSGKYWARWGEAVEAAGFKPNRLQKAHSEDLLIEKYILLIRELGRIPIQSELRLRRRSDTSFPNDKTFSRWGTKAQLLAKAAEYCRTHTGFDDILQLCNEALPQHDSEPEHSPELAPEMGVVYLMKSGRYYKIGRTNALGRREYELAIQLPKKPPLCTQSAPMTPLESRHTGITDSQIKEQTESGLRSMLRTYKPSNAASLCEPKPTPYNRKNVIPASQKSDPFPLSPMPGSQANFGLGTHVYLAGNSCRAFPPLAANLQPGTLPVTGRMQRRYPPVYGQLASDPVVPPKNCSSGNTLSNLLPHDAGGAMS